MFGALGIILEALVVHLGFFLSFGVIFGVLRATV